MTMDRAQQIIQMYSHLKRVKSNFEQHWQDVTDFVLPDRSNVNRQSVAGEQRGQVRYDGTATEAAEILAGNMSATFVPMSMKWLSLAIRDKQLSKQRRVRDWLDGCRDNMLDALFESNFYLVMDEVFLDLVGYGTVCPHVEMIDGRLHFECWPVREYVFTRGVDGRARSVYREVKMTVEQVIQRFSEHPGKVSLGDTVERALRDGAEPKDMQVEITLIHCVEPRANFDPRKPDFRNMPFASYWVNSTDRVLIAEGGYHERPSNVARWRLNSDDSGWGRSPTLTAMADIKSLNEFRRLMHKAAAKDVDPPLVVEHKGVIGNVRTSPNGITYVRRDARFEYLTSGQRMDTAQFDLQALKADIRAYYYADHLRLPPPQAQPMTATEIQIRWELMERLLGPTLGRLIVELMNPIVERVFGLMMRGGMLPEPPDEIVDAEIDIEYIGPLARAQQLPDVMAIERTYQSASNIAAVTGDPSVLDLLDADAAIKRIGMLHGVPSEVLRDDAEVAKLRESRAEQQAAMQERQDVMMAADVASKVPAQAGAA